MINGYAIRKSAEIVEINIATSFFWRHKILDCISTFSGKGYLDGVIEADEVFLQKVLKVHNHLIFQDALIEEANKLRKGESRLWEKKMMKI